MSYVVIFSTTPSADEAQKISTALVEKRLVACSIAIGGARSTYRWKGKICNDQEVMLVMKTRKEKVEGVKRELKKLHSYECPELIVLPVSDGLPDYLKWIDESVAD